MGHKRSKTNARPWEQMDLMGLGQGVGGRHTPTITQPGGGGYLNGCTPPKVALEEKTAQKKFGKILRFAPVGQNSDKPVDSRELALLDELDSMGLSRVMLQIAHTIGFDNFMAMWQILDGSYEAMADNDSGIYIRLQRLSAYRRFQRNRFIEAMAVVGMTHPEIAKSVKRDLGEKVSDRHLRRLMKPAKVAA